MCVPVIAHHRTLTLSIGLLLESVIPARLCLAVGSGLMKAWEQRSRLSLALKGESLCWTITISQDLCSFWVTKFQFACVLIL